MNAPFGFSESVGVFAADQHRGALDARRFTREHVIDLHFPASALGPALIHAHQHVGPIARLGSASSSVDAQDAIGPVVRPLEKDFQFERIQFLEESG